MLLTVRRISPHKKLCAISLKEYKEIIFSNPTYVFKKTCPRLGTEETYSCVPLDGDDKVTISYDAQYCYMEYEEELDLNGTRYEFIVRREITEKDGYVAMTYSNFDVVETIPSTIENLQIIEQETIYDTETSIPTHVTIGWDAIDSTTNNLDCLGIEFYYSDSVKGKNEWKPFEKLRDKTVGDTGSTITRIALSETSCVINVTELGNALTPKDIKIAAVIEGETQQSEMSNTVSMESHNMIGTRYFRKIGFFEIRNGNEDDTYSQVKDKQLANPYYVMYGENCFEEDAFVWCERYSAYEESNKRSRIEYYIGATKQLTAPVGFSFYLPYPSSYSFDVRVDNKPIVSTYDVKTQRLTFMIDKATAFEILITNKEYKPGYIEYEQVFEETTRRILKRLPTWFKMRRNPVGSVGAYFLNVIGLELSDIESLLEYASNQTHVATLDKDQLSQIYKIKLPEDTLSKDRFAITGDGVVLERCDSLAYFLKPPYFMSEEEMIYHNNLFLIDYEERIIYTRKSFTSIPKNKYGAIKVYIFRDGAEEPWYEQEIPLQPHSLWNFFDEFGMLFDLKRLKDESNVAFKERILDVFQNKSSSTKEGLLNGIARELGIRKNVVWSDTTKDLIIKDRMVVCNYIKLNGVSLPITKVWIDGDDNIVIKGDKDYPENSKITYVTGIEMHSLNNKKDRSLQNQLFSSNGLATTLLLQYVSRIKGEIPIEWNSFKWNEGYWDANLPENGGVAFVPAIMDASISKFKDYKTKGLQNNANTV